MATASEVREGFLCPMCMKDLGTVTMLQDHFEEEHSSEDKDVLHQLRGRKLNYLGFHVHHHIFRCVFLKMCMYFLKINLNKGYTTHKWFYKLSSDFL